MSQLQAAPAIGKAPPNPIFSADVLKPLLQIGYQTPSSPTLLAGAQAVGRWLCALA